MKSRMCMAALLATAAFSARSQVPTPPGVQLYGVVDLGVEYVDKVGAAGGHVTRMPSLSGGQLPSRWGLRGTEDLGGGLKAVYTLEAGFAADSGISLQGGRAFGRQAYVGLAGDWGTLTFGRHWTMTFFSMLEADVIGPAVFGLATFDPYLPNARTDNSVSYRGTIRGFTVGATYSLGRDATPPSNCAGENAAHECRAWSLLLKYDAPTWGVAAAHDKLEGGAAGGFFGQPPGTIAAAGNNDARTHVNGYVRFGSVKVAGGVIRRRFDALPRRLSTDLYYAGLSAPVAGPLSVDAQLIRLDDARPGADATTVVLRANYAFSRRTVGYVLLGHVRNGPDAAYSVTAGETSPVAPAAGQGQSGVMVGIRHSF